MKTPRETRRAWHTTGLALLFALSALACTPSWSARLPADASPNARLYAAECDGGEAASCYALALLFQLGPETGHGVPQDDVSANELFERACEGGHAPACAPTEGSAQ